MPQKEPREVNVWPYIGREVEARTVGGGCYRGLLEACDERFLRIRRHTGCDVIIPLCQLTALLDEERSFASTPRAAQPETGEES